MSYSRKTRTRKRSTKCKKLDIGKTLNHSNPNGLRRSISNNRWYKPLFGGWRPNPNLSKLSKRSKKIKK